MPPAKPQFDKLTRNILATKPRVTRFKINWDDTPNNGGINGDGVMDADETAGLAVAESSSEMGSNLGDVRMNENSNSLAMEC